MKDSTRAIVATIQKLVEAIPPYELERAAVAACESGDRREAQRIACLLRLKELGE